MSLLSRYLAAEFVRLFLLCLGGGTTLYLVVDLFDRIDQFLRYGATAAEVLLYLVYKVPLMVYQIAPAVVLVSVLLTVGLLARRNEILAFRTSGIPVWRIAAPFASISLLVSFAAFLLNEYVVPPTFQRSEYIRRVLIKGKTPSGLAVRNRIWFKGDEGIYNIASFLPAKKELQGISILRIARPFHLAYRLDAVRGKWDGQKWVFYDVVERSFTADGEMEMISSPEKAVSVSETPADFQEIQKEAEGMPLFLLRRYVQKIESEGYDPTPYRVELHKRISFPLLNVITVFLGLPFSMRLPRHGGLALGVGLSLAVGFVYWTLFAITLSIGQQGLLPPFVAAWAANVLFGALGVFLLLRLEEKAAF
ncbi:MAG: LPS export ABC transporter permease LptG [bacterium]